MKRALSPIVLVAMLLMSAGCATPAQRLATTERVVSIAADSTAALIESRVLDNKPAVLRAILATSAETRKAMVKARLFVAGGNDADANFWIDQALARVAEWALQNAEAKGAR